MKSYIVPKTSRITCTLPVETVEAVDSVASRIGCTRSAVIAHLLSDSCYQMLEVVDSVVPARRKKGAVARRSSGRSVEELGAIFDSLEEHLRRRDIENWLAEGDGFHLTREQDG